MFWQVTYTVEYRLPASLVYERINAKPLLSELLSHVILPLITAYFYNDYTSSVIGTVRSVCSDKRGSYCMYIQFAYNIHTNLQIKS